MAEHDGAAMPNRDVTIAALCRAYREDEASPFHFVCWDDRRDRVGERLARPYFGMRKWDQESVDFMLPYGEWIRVFRRNGLALLPP